MENPFLLKYSYKENVFSELLISYDIAGKNKLTTGECMDNLKKAVVPQKIHFYYNTYTKRLVSQSC